jgi:death on curing protein
LCELAALYAAGLVKNHPFVEGNKRTGAVACELFLVANGLRLLASDTELVGAILGLASGQIDETVFAAWLRESTEPLDPEA